MAAQNESEIEIYAKIGDFSGLEKCSGKIYQEQATIRTDKGKIRSRMFKKEKNSVWHFEVTSKIPKVAAAGNEGVKVNDEDNQRSSEGIHKLFMNTVPKFERKVRHLFKIEKAHVQAGKLNAQLDVDDMFFEVDVFIRKDGSYSPWCKIDVEVDKIKDQLVNAGLSITDYDITARVSHLPLGLTSIFINDGSDPKMKELVQTIFDGHYLRSTDEVGSFKQAEPDAAPAATEEPAAINAKVE